MRAGLRAVAVLLLLGAPAQALELAAWVVRDRLTSPESVEEAVRAARDAGVTTLIVQVRGRGDAYYATELAPRAEALGGAPEGFDPLAEVLVRARGLRVLAWLNVFLVWSETFPPADAAHVVRAHPEWLLADIDGRPVADYGPRERALGWIEGIYADPASSGYREHFAAVAAEVAARYPVDGVHLDFVRYPGPGYGRAGEAAAAFREAWGIDPRWLPSEDDEADGALAGAVRAWADGRAGAVTELVRAVRRATRLARPGVELSAAVLPDRLASSLEKGQDWARWAREGLVDELYPMVYFGGAERVGAQLAEMRAAVAGSGTRVAAGLGAYRKAPETIAAEAAEAWALGCDGVALFDLGSLLAAPGGVGAYAGAAASWGAAAAAQGEAWDEEEAPSEASRRDPVPLREALGRLASASAPEPPWVELDGLFRYVHPRDGAERRRAQRRRAEEALARLRAGEEFAAVARELSQWSTRAAGGGLGRRYLVAGRPADDLLAAAEPGAATDLVEAANGFWIYRVRSRGGGVPAGVAELPWAAKRALLWSELFKSKRLNRASSE